MRKMDKIMEMYGLHSADLAAEPYKMNDPEVVKQKVYAYMGDISKVKFIKNTKYNLKYAKLEDNKVFLSNTPKEGFEPALVPHEE